MHTGPFTSRRSFLRLTGTLATGVALPAISDAVLAAGRNEGKGNEAEVNPVEGLMREHGVLCRVLLIYEEMISRIDEARGLPAGVVADSAGIIRRFVEDYHEKLEEEVIFPRLQKAGNLDGVIKVLLEQHQAGRCLTDSILKLSATETLKTEVKPAPKNEDPSAAMQQLYGGTPLLFKNNGTSVFTRKGPDTKRDVSSAMQQFIRMYRPHTAWEDTSLFPAFRSIVSLAEFDDLSGRLKEKEEKLFGKEGFEKMVESVEEIEKKLGMHDLARFTAKA